MFDPKLCEAHNQGEITQDGKSESEKGQEVNYMRIGHNERMTEPKHIVEVEGEHEREKPSKSF
jgi:hypothetical protein